MPPPPGDIANPETNTAKVTVHPLERKEKTAALPNNKIDEIKEEAKTSEKNTEGDMDAISWSKPTMHEDEPLSHKSDDSKKSVTVESRPHSDTIGKKAEVVMEPTTWSKETMHRKSDFAPKDKDIPIAYEGSGVKPFALAEEMAFAQLAKPHKKGKKHHKKAKKS